MGIRIATAAEYEASLRKLFPIGEYWDEQFADENIDCVMPDTSVQEVFEAEITTRLLANHLIYFTYSEVY